MVRRNEKCIGVIILCTRGSGLAVSVLVAKMEVNVTNDPVNSNYRVRNRYVLAQALDSVLPSSHGPPA